MFLSFLHVALLLIPTLTSFSYSSDKNCTSRSTKNEFHDCSRQVSEDVELFLNNCGWIGTAEEEVIHNYEKLKENVPAEEVNKINEAIFDAKIAAYTICVVDGGYKSYHDYLSQKNIQSRDLIIDAAISYLRSIGCNLTVELMNKFLSQTVAPAPGFFYEPIYGWVANYGSSSLSIIQSNTVTGSGTFELTNSTYESDLSYAIRQFDFDKKAANTKGFVLTDTYDFSYETPSGPFDFVNIANNHMYDLQESGTCHPFDIKIKCAPISNSISIDTYTELNEINYEIDKDVYVAFQLTVFGIYQNTVLMTSGSSLTSIYIYDNSNHDFISSYSGNGYYLNTLCKPSFNANITYYILVKSTSNGIVGGKLSVFKDYLSANQIFSTNIITSVGNYSNTTQMCSMTSYVISMSSYGAYTFTINNGYEEYGFGIYLLDPTFNTTIQCTWHYEPTYSTLAATLSPAFDYLLLIFYEDILDGGHSFILNISCI